MKILAHRGFWSDVSEQNTIYAIEKAFASGYGVETDLRDLSYSVMVSHDSPDENVTLTLDGLLSVYRKYNMSLPLALNVKADGLQERCKASLQANNISLSKVFFFDMSVPDALTYLHNKLPCFTRFSDEEITPAYIDRACGVWVDGFKQDCIDKTILEFFLDKGLSVCLVSPELHKRSYLETWEKWATIFNNNTKSVMICTDFPDKADDFFNG